MKQHQKYTLFSFLNIKFLPEEVSLRVESNFSHGVLAAGLAAGSGKVLSLVVPFPRLLGSRTNQIICPGAPSPRRPLHCSGRCTSRYVLINGYKGFDMDGSTRSVSRQATSRPVSAANSSPSTPRLRSLLKASSVDSPRTFSPNASIVLVGIRGCGKTSLGYIAARALGRRLVESDDEFERKTGCTRAQFLKKTGQNEGEYRMQERLVMESMLVNNERDAVITCGVGSLESVGQALLKRYALTHPVIHIIRDSDHIRELLRLPKESNLMQRLDESDRSHRLCSNFEFYNLFDGGAAPGTVSGVASPNPGGPRSPRYTGMLQRTQEDFIRFVNLVLGFSNDYMRVLQMKIKAAALCPIDRIYTYALSIDFAQLVEINTIELECGADAIELQLQAADIVGHSLTVDSPWISILSEQIASLRRRVSAPIILHVDRSTFLQRQSPTLLNQDESYMELLHLGIRMGVEFLTVDIDLDEQLIEQIRRVKGSTILIGDFTDLNPTKLGWDDPSRLRRHTKATRAGCDMIRMSQVTLADEDNVAIRRFVQQVTFKEDSKPLIAYNLTRPGRVSMCYNTILTPVTHDSIQPKSKSQKGLLSLQEASRLIYDLGLLDPLQFSLFGANILYSLSPALHNAGYEACGLPHNYRIHQSARFTDIERLLLDPRFGGCSVSLPYKIEVPRRVDSMSPEAQAIGACNTIIPIRASRKDGSRVLDSRSGKTVGFHGENTDWIAMFIVIRRNLSPANQIRPQTSGLVIGAGGMARAAVYALIRLEVQNVFIYNRTIANAEEVAAHFREVTSSLRKYARSTRPIRHQFTVIKSLDEPWPSRSSEQLADFEQPTIIISCVPAHQIGSTPAPNLNIPTPWLQSVNGGVIVEVSSSEVCFAVLIESDCLQTFNYPPNGTSTTTARLWASMGTGFGTRSTPRAGNGTISVYDWQNRTSPPNSKIGLS